MAYVVFLLIVAVGLGALMYFFPNPTQFTLLPGGPTFETSLWLLIAGSALAGAIASWLAGRNQLKAFSARVKKLEDLVRRAKESLAERDEKITEYEEQLASLGVLTPEAEEAAEEKEAEEEAPEQAEEQPADEGAPQDEQAAAQREAQ